jgi:hypothetical protein
MQDNMGKVKVPTNIKTAVESLQKGDYVLLDWQHDYVTKGGATFPERTVIQLKRITCDEADKLPKVESEKPSARSLTQ